ncbi:MAG: cyclic nucleotide-binding domain-containing protein [Microcystaceae cyanobacterium]
MLLNPTETVKLYQTHGSPKIFQAGEIIFKEGDQETIMYGIIEGSVEMQIQGKVIETIEQGDVFGIGAMVHADHKRTSTAIAKTDCTLAFLDKEHFLFAVQQTPLFGLETLRSYSDRFRRLKADL